MIMYVNAWDGLVKKTIAFGSMFYYYTDGSSITGIKDGRTYLFDGEGEVIYMRAAFSVGDAGL